MGELEFQEILDRLAQAEKRMEEIEGELQYIRALNKGWMELAGKLMREKIPE